MMEDFKLNDLKLDASELQKVVWEKTTPLNVTVALATVVSSYVALKAFKFYLKKRKLRHIPGPPTKGIFGFFVGNTPEIKEMIRNGKVMPDAFVEWHKKYGDVFKFQMYNQLIVVTADKNAIKDALITRNFPKDQSVLDRVAVPMGERFLGSGLVTELDNEVWKHRRAIFNPGFHRHVLVTFVGHFNQLVNTLSDKLRTRADNKTVVSVMDELNRLTLDAIAMIAFGMNTESITRKDSILNDYMSRILKTAFENLLNPFLKYQPWHFQEVKEFRQMVRHVRKVGRENIVSRLNSYKNDEHVPDDILSSILSSYKGENIDLEKMTDDFATFFLAGQETTANTLAFCFLELGKNPEIVRKAREEIDRVLGERTEVTYQDVNELKYCSAIFKESLRLYPPAPQINRKTPDEMTIQGISVPKNTLLFISTYMNSRSEKFWKDPLVFKPERFLKTPDNPESGKENYVYLPFSLGPRNCIGQNFAQLEGVIVIAKLLQKFDFRLDPTQSFESCQKLTLYPKDGTRCFISLRN